MKYPILSGDISVYIVILSAFLLIAVNLLIASCYIFVKYKNKYTANLYKAREEARLAVENKNLVLSNVSRLIRNRMTRVVGMNELIFRECADNVTRDRSAQIRKSVDEILSLMQEVQDYSMLERNLIDVVYTEFNLASLIIECITLTSPLYKANDLILDLSVDKTLPKGVIGDSFKLRRCLLYLLTFACKKTHNGNVSFSVDKAETEGEKYSICFTLHVSGLDISMSKLEYLLTYDSAANDMIFSHSDMDLLDLYLASRYVKILGSELEVMDSGKDTFDISFTVATGVSDAEAIGDIRNIHRANKFRGQNCGLNIKATDVNVLFIDDKELSLFYVRDLLAGAGIELDYASTCEEASAKLARNGYDLIMLHDVMKTDDGAFYIDKIRNGEISMANSRIPCIAVTSDIKSTWTEVESYKKFDSFLMNPITPSELEKVLIENLPDSKVETTGDCGDYPGIRSIEDIRKYSEGYEDLYENAVQLYKRSKAYKD